MADSSRGMDRRVFLMSSAGMAAAAFQGASVSADTSHSAFALPEIKDELVRDGVNASIEKTLMPAALQKAYPGHFTVVADGSHFGAENTWPGLDSWELAGAYLLLGKVRLVLDYFDFVQASQRKDGNIPFAIFPGETAPGGMDTFLRGMHYPDDVYTYTPTPHDGQPADSNMSARKWIGLFDHWQPKANPLSVLGPISYILTAKEIFDKTQSVEWLRNKFDSIANAGRYVLTRKSDNGLIGGSGFYVERPPRYQWDGVTQCYAVRAFRLLADMSERTGKSDQAAIWNQHADTLAGTFRTAFWKENHFAEYIHPEHGVVDHHGLTDVNWAAIAFDVATKEQIDRLWPLLVAERHFWHGDMPTQTVTKPYAYQDWELCEPLPWLDSNGELYDVAAMGRVWFLEAMACLKMGDHDRLRESVRKVCAMGKRHDWFWYERYHRLQVWDVFAAGPKGYCEYAAVLTRIILGNPSTFT
jgi:hypothetical protein